MIIINNVYYYYYYHYYFYYYYFFTRFIMHNMFTFYFSNNRIYACHVILTVLYVTPCVYMTFDYNNLCLNLHFNYS